MVKGLPIMKTEISYFSISFIAVMLTASQAFAVTEAGQKQQRMEHRHGSLYMTNNMTDIGNMTVSMVLLQFKIITTMSMPRSRELGARKI